MSRGRQRARWSQRAPPEVERALSEPRPGERAAGGELLGGGAPLPADMKLSRQFTVFGSAIFCVVIFSLYLMLDRGHFDHPKSPRREGTFPKVSGAEGTGRALLPAEGGEFRAAVLKGGWESYSTFLFPQCCWLEVRQPPPLQVPGGRLGLAAS